jgi:hypothetical protein
MQRHRNKRACKVQKTLQVTQAATPSICLLVISKNMNLIQTSTIIAIIRDKANEMNEL